VKPPRWHPGREYEVRVPCDVHGEVWARVTAQFRDGSPEQCVCPACADRVARQYLEAHPGADPAEARDVAEGVVRPMTLLGKVRPPSEPPQTTDFARVLDKARTAQERLAAGRGGNGIMTAGSSEDDGE